MDVAGRLPANFVNESALRRDPDPSALDARSGGNPAPAVRSGQVGAPVSNCFCLPKELPSKDEAAANVRELEASAPDPADYPGGKFSLQYWIDTAAHGWELHCARQLLLEAYKQEAAEGSATTEAIFEAAEREGVAVVVLGDEEYAERFPGTGGVTVGDTVYLPVSALESGEGVLEHELMHGLLNSRPEIFDPDVPLEQQVEAVRELFESIGLDPDDGERLVRAAEGMPSVDADHVQTYVLSVIIHREKNGLPPLTEAQRDSLYEDAAARETALGVLRYKFEINGEEVSLRDLGEGPQFLAKLMTMSPEDLETLAAEVEARWNETSLADEYPLTSDTPRERLQEMQKILMKLQDEGALEQYWN